MNATKFYVSACRLVIQANPDNASSWQDIYRVLPLLRDSLSCTVCAGLLTEPYTPEETTCEHHVCAACRNGYKSVQPQCSWCKDKSKYIENKQLKTLIQSYKKLCAFIKVTRMYALLEKNKEVLNIIRESEEPPKMKGAVEPLVNNMHSEPVNIKQEIYPEEESEIISPSCLVNDVTSCSGTRRGSTASTADMDGVLRTPCKTETNNIGGHINPVVKDEIFSSPAAKKGKYTDIETYLKVKAELKECKIPESAFTVDSVDRNWASLHDQSIEWQEMVEDEYMDSSNQNHLETPSPDAEHDISRSETPSPPNSQRFAKTPQNGARSTRSAEQFRQDKEDSVLLMRRDTTGSKVHESFILQPRSEAGLCDTDGPATSRINLEWGSSGGRRLSNGGSKVTATPLILPRLSSEEDTPRTVPPKLVDKKRLGKKMVGCRCGAASSSPGKLTCCGQRCPCYVSLKSCIDCKCRGCNNPNLPGGGKSVPYRKEILIHEDNIELETSVTVDGQRPRSRTGIRVVSTATKSSTPATPAAALCSGDSGFGSSVVRVPSANSDDVDSMTDVDINTIPVVNLTSPSSYKTILGSSPVVHRLLPTTQSSGTTCSSRSAKAGSPLSTVTVMPSSSLSTVSIPLNSLSPRLKLRPVDQLQRREIKARVIPTSFRLKAAPYTRLAVNGKVNSKNSVGLQTISLMSLLKNSKKSSQNIQVMNTSKDEGKSDSTI